MSIGHREGQPLSYPLSRPGNAKQFILSNNSLLLNSWKRSPAQWTWQKVHVHPVN